MGWLTDWRRKRVLEKHRMDEAPLAFRSLSPELHQRSRKLRDLALLFLAEKEFSGAHGFEITDAIRLSIAAQACLPVLELGLDWYGGWAASSSTPATSACGAAELDEDGVLHEWDDELAGEAMPGGPVVLSWDAAAQRYRRSTW